MKKKIKDIIGLHKETPALILGHGPSLNNEKKNIKGYKNKGFLIFGLNDWYRFYEESPHYWVLANNELVIQNQINQINRSKATVIYADSVDKTDKKWIAKNIKNDFIPYDQRHFNGERCSCPRCPCRNSNFKFKDQTIQEELKSLTGSDKQYGSGDTVFLHALSSAVIMGCSPIYFVGVHIDYRLGYANNIGKRGLDIKAYKIFDNTRNRIYRDMQIIVESAKNIGIPIFNMDLESKIHFIEKRREDTKMGLKEAYIPSEIPKELKGAYTLGGKIPVGKNYIRESSTSKVRVYNKQLIDTQIKIAREEIKNPIKPVSAPLIKAFKKYSIEGKKVLVIGSRKPFYEAICLEFGAFPTTVDFGKLKSESNLLKTIEVNDLDSSDLKYDIAISISAYEHTGLGRYGDPLDPNGDVKAINNLKRHVKKNGLLFLAVPIGLDALVWNAHRVYGDLRFPLLIENWEKIDSFGVKEKIKQKLFDYYQPVFVLRNR